MYAIRSYYDKESFSKEWMEYSVKTFNVSAQDYLKSDKFQKHRDLQRYFDAFLFSLLEKINYQGIVEVRDQQQDTLINQEIVLLRGNIAEIKHLNEFFTLKSAYQHLSSEMEQELRKNQSKLLVKYRDFLANFSIETYLTPNIFYDQQASDRNNFV